MTLRPGIRVAIPVLVCLESVFGQVPPAEQADFFEKKVRPILVNKCQGCHDPKSRTAGLDLTSAAGLRKGADTGPVIVAGDIENSRLLQVTGYQERIKMPPSGKLSQDDLETLREWVKLGAPWPAETNNNAPEQPLSKKGYTRGQKEFWSFRPLREVTPPPVQNEKWVRSTIDRFILARLESAKLQPAPPASKLILIRRATLDLTGLPPSEDEIRAFLADDSPNAFVEGDRQIARLSSLR